jgi:uncharacterized metal-binding protein YceD (DUF177 family)
MVDVRVNLEMEETVTQECQACLQVSKGALEVSLVLMVLLKRGKDQDRCQLTLQLMILHSLEDKDTTK